MNRIYKSAIKRPMDFLAALFGFIALSPIFVIVTTLLLMVNQGRPFFVQVRPGKNEKLFKLVKFKTMNDRRDEEHRLLPDEQRLTAIGKVLRSTSFDEIPQLINVLKGEMSLIGPRPLLTEYLNLYNDKQARRHEVRPGITGWAQVNGRNLTDWQTRFDLDVWYVDNLSLILDLKIVVLTMKNVFAQHGISSETSSTMEKFKGN